MSGPASKPGFLSTDTSPYQVCDDGLPYSVCFLIEFVLRCFRHPHLPQKVPGTSHLPDDHGAARRAVWLAFPLRGRHGNPGRFRRIACCGTGARNSCSRSFPRHRNTASGLSRISHGIGTPPEFRCQLAEFAGGISQDFHALLHHAQGQCPFSESGSLPPSHISSAIFSAACLLRVSSNLSRFMLASRRLLSGCESHFSSRRPGLGERLDVSFCTRCPVGTMDCEAIFSRRILVFYDIILCCKVFKLVEKPKMSVMSIYKIFLRSMIRWQSDWMCSPRA